MISLVILPYNATEYVRGFMAYEDGSVYFNRTNNLKGGFEFYRYSGYVSFAPQVLAYIYSFLPYLLQSFCYALTALLVGLWMFYQFKAILIDAGVHPRLAFGVGLAAAACLHFVAEDLYLNLTHLIWPALLGASIYVVRIALAGASPHWFATILASMSFASHPLAVASLPVIGVGLYVRRARLTAFIPHAMVIVLGILFVINFTDTSKTAASFYAILKAFRFPEQDDMYFAFYFVTRILPIIIILAGIVAGLVKLPSLMRSGFTRAAAVLSASLILIPIYLALHVASDRFADGYIAERYFTPMVTFAIVSLTVSFVRAPWLMAVGQRLERIDSARAHAFLAVWLVMSLVAGSAIFWTYYANRLRFLATAQCVHEEGSPGIAIAAEPNEYSLVIANGLGGAAQSNTDERELMFLAPSPELLERLQRLCPGIQPSYIEALRSARIYGAKAF